MIPIDPKWTNIVYWPLRVSAPVAAASSVLVILTHYGVFDLGGLGSYANPLIVIVAVLSSSQAIFGIGYELFAPWREANKLKALTARQAIRRQEKEDERTAQQEKVLKRLESLSKQEIDVVARCLRDGSPSFYTWVYASNVGLLQGKGLVWCPGSSHNNEHYPFSFHDFVWEELMRRKDEFLENDAQHKAAELSSKPRR
jgi:hypothetical protein